jgi:DNA-binding transcriptional LysR family regulator
MNNNDWLFFKVLAEEKNITKAAKRLYITQPSLTEKIKKLEKELNIKLIIRQPRGIVLTQAGELISYYAAKSLADYRKVLDQLSEIQNEEISGYVRLGCSNVFAKNRMPELISDFHKNYPKVHVSLKTGFSQNLYRDFLHGELQIAIIRDSHNWSQSKYLIWQEALCIISAVPLDLETLPKYAYIHYHTEGPLQYVLDDWWYTRYTKQPNLISSIDSMDICMDMVARGVGYTVLSESNALSRPNLYKYSLRLENGALITKGTWMFHRDECKNILAVQAFIDFVLKKYPPQEVEKNNNFL